MPPALSSPTPSRSWWSRSKSSKEPLRPHRSFSSLAIDDDEKYPSTASSSSSKAKDVIPSLKPKRLPTLTIQDPPSPLPSPNSYSTSRPGTSQSSTKSLVPGDQYDYDAVSEPRTPSDLPRDRLSYQPSVMTAFSEIDPFASAGIVVHHLPQDPNRLSVYSDSSRPDAIPQNRRSYGSSSSNSHGNSSDSFRHAFYGSRFPPIQEGVRVQCVQQHRCPHDPRTRSSTHLARKRADMDYRAVPPSPSVPMLSPMQPMSVRRKASGSVSPVSSHAPTPPSITRSRSASNATNPDSPVSAGARPSVLMRKASSSRVHLPPIPSPPTSDLPPPPRFPASNLPYDISSSLNFAPSLMHDSYDLGPEKPKAKRRTNRDLPPQSATESNSPSPLSSPAMDHIPHKAPKLLKKMSAQNLPQRISTPSEEFHAGKTPRKQRSFHTSRVPLPPLPGLRVLLATLPQHPASPILEPRRGSVASPRKRLFSGSSARRSTSSHGPTSPSVEDDKRSIFSFESDVRPVTSSGVEPITMSFGTAGAPLALMTKNACISPSSFWDEQQAGGASTNTASASQSDYTPQYIMAPADQLKLAEKLEDAQSAEEEAEREAMARLVLQPGDFGMTFAPTATTSRSRSNSVLSSTSLAQGHENGSRSRVTSLTSLSSHLSAAPSRMSQLESLRMGPLRSSSMLAKGSSRVPSLTTRPSTAQASLSLSPPHSPRYSQSSPSPVIPSASLPPPPRRRPSRSDLNEITSSGVADKRASVVPMNPLSPPPMRANRARHDSTGARSIASSRPPSSFNQLQQKSMKRRSLMRKPSFLDIDDEPDDAVDGDGSDSDGPEPDSPAMESSFLDMDRGKGSFDTIRSVDSSYY
ncbi:uncharacterized protein BXZ73DRAFT_87188 [Epithele typhae]|uniref:uncharacterized protein n=1 Tax=Epithele typhae TaxID=378194 RepID=UPI00200796E8|nr:uncharacterized protein BXZ73DRAFT_87188 [Epithele typhae]KAH9944255.1 hypothetical protein BXZ73DRAFT_87188 [Epithele typhae]